MRMLKLYLALAHLRIARWHRLCGEFHTEAAAAYVEGLRNGE